MLTSFEDGRFTWVCPHCNEAQAGSAEHEGVQWQSDGRTAALPHCSCGSRTFINTHWPESLVQPPILDVIDNPGSSWHGHLQSVSDPPGAASNAYVVETRQEERVGSDGLKHLVVLVDRVSQRTFIDHHRAFAQHLHSIGKKVPTLEEES